ncbi:hypothetical protein RHMOL_Rhmol13G0005900 [Rhododendron molle]|uniref:Uncharacterized protein n=1 Tax=Rhododendron molle TaxID=49168 RepID=A0ACC0L1J0_RHOML|nr:hypothetical protein RHMOL_Rhmol13G0005900 [Rhododendron molle]
MNEGSNLLLVSFSGEIIAATVADKASSVDNWVHNVLSTHRGQQIAVGLDCKSRPHPISITFVGIKIHENTRKLEEEYQLVCSKKVDIRALAKIWFPISFHGKSSLRALAHEVAGLCMQKTEKPYKCDWESRVLDNKLIEHASIDAYACYRIANKLIQEI